MSDLLAEGFGRGTPGEKIRYCQMASGSLEETQNQLRRCVNRKLIDRTTFYRAWHLSVAISRMLDALIEYFEQVRADKLDAQSCPSTSSPPAPL